MYYGEVQRPADEAVDARERGDKSYPGRRRERMLTGLRS